MGPVVAHLGLLQLLSLVALLGGGLGIMLFAWGYHAVKSIRTHRNARNQTNG